ncbi:MAG TPA: aminotransferase class IV [Jatrophihabitans sp.]|jgi:branched-chain amino acid aminotransferase|nr:aminotransferase class IV [Jatrophihabitans sp.]
MDGIVYIDGRYVAPDEASLSMFDSGFHLGLTVFDTIPLYRSRVFRLDAHLDRFVASLKAVRFDVGRGPAELYALVMETARRSGLTDGTINILATRGQRTPGAVLWDWKPTLIVQCLDQRMMVTAEQRENGVRACISAVRSIPPQSVPPQVKHANRLPNYFAMMDAHARGVDEPILLDAEGYVTEGPNYNLFAIRGGRILTPHHGVLRGITRDTIMKIAEQHGHPVSEQPLTGYDVYTAEEVFITSTSRGALAMVEVDGRLIGDGRPGVITTQLNDTYWAWREHSDYAVPVHAEQDDETQLAGAAKAAQ